MKKSFKSQYILEKLLSINNGFSYNIIGDHHNEVIGIVWMTSYMRNNFEGSVIFLSGDVMYS